MILVQEVCEVLEEFAPSRLAEDWDNVGLLVGRGDREARRIMTCLTVTHAVIEECESEHVDLVVTHHPLPFRPLKRLTSDTTPGDLLLRLIENRVAVYSPHTAFDSAPQGINQNLAELLGLHSIRPLIAPQTGPSEPELAQVGSGRWGQLTAPVPVRSLIETLKQALHVSHLQLAGQPTRLVEKVAIACGSAGAFLEHAVRQGCDAFVTGETGFHTVLEAEARGVALILLGHYASERFAVERLAHVLSARFPGAEVWPSRHERDPLQLA